MPSFRELPMRVLLYRGISPISRLIRWQTRSIYSHAALQLPDGRIVEAWHKGGVQRCGLGDNHTPGTLIDVFEITEPFGFVSAEQFALAQVGGRYDFRSVARFLSRRDASPDDVWFCSELVAAAVAHGGLSLLHRIEPAHISPRDLSLSPYLRLAGRLEV